MANPMQEKMPDEMETGLIFGLSGLEVDTENGVLVYHVR